MAWHHQQHEPLIVLMEDEIIHTQEHPFCPDSTCPCREDQELLAELNEAVTNGLLTPEEATRFTQGKTL